MARSQAEAWSTRGVTSNVLVPGFVRTPLNERLSADPATVAGIGAGGLSGAPLAARSLEVLRLLSSRVGDALTLVKPRKAPLAARSWTLQPTDEGTWTLRNGGTAQEVRLLLP